MRNPVLRKEQNLNAYPNTDLHPRRMGALAAILALVVLVATLAFAASSEQAVAPDQVAIQPPALDLTGLARAMSLDLAPEIDQEASATLPGDDPTAFGLPPSPEKVSEPQGTTFTAQPADESTALSLAASPEKAPMSNQTTPKPTDTSPSAPKARSESFSDTCPECVRED
ncbi:MAG TPA: hypothetical protein VI565_09445 [Burkholderiales bacterium]|nr:hypothetical protein [Burkholderiales bacterium]